MRNKSEIYIWDLVLSLIAKDMIMGIYKTSSLHAINVHFNTATIANYNGMVIKNVQKAMIEIWTNGQSLTM